jgi:hypothetical protein
MYKKISILILLLAITSCKNGDSDKMKKLNGALALERGKINQQMVVI